MPSAAFASGEAVGLAIKAALGPVLERQAVLMEKCTRLEAELSTVRPELVALRERAAVLESRPSAPGSCGPAGADGWSPDEITVIQDPEDRRVLTFSFRGGEIVKKAVVRLCTPEFCGKWKSDRAYLPGDEVLLDGGLWRCETPTRARPGRPDDGWVLVVKSTDGR